MGRPLNKRYFDPVPTSNGEGVASVTIDPADRGSYTALPTVTVSAPELPNGVTATGASTMRALSAVVTVGGSGATNADYAPGNTLTVVGGTGTAPVFTVSSVKVRTAANVANAGGFLNGNTVTFTTGFSTPAVLTLTVVGAAITAVAITNAGIRSTALPADPVQPDQTNGPGTLAGTTFNLGFEVNAISLTTAGSLTALPANPAATTVNTGTGTGATLTLAYEVLSYAIINGGSGYVDAPTFAFTGGTAGNNASTSAVALTTTGTNVILATAFVVGGTAALDADIIKQTSTNEYVMQTTEGQSVVTLVASDTPTAGQASITATDAGGAAYWVMKLTSRLAVLQQKVDGTGVYDSGETAPWTLESTSIDPFGQTVQITSA